MPSYLNGSQHMLRGREDHSRTPDDVLDVCLCTMLHVCPLNRFHVGPTFAFALCFKSRDARSDRVFGLLRRRPQEGRGKR